MKKRILSLLLCVAMLLTLLPQTVLFASAGTNSGTCGDNLTWSYNSSTCTLTITGTGAMTDWNYDSKAPWYSYRSSIQSVSLPDGLTSIGSEAFYGCTGLTGITIPDSVTSIGYYAFCDCTGLTAISIPDSVTSIGDAAFGYCSGLTSITVAEGNPVYDSRNNCNAIIETATNTLIAGCKNTVIPDSVASIGLNAFEGCTGLTNITIGNGVTSICDYAFFDCTGLTAITIPDSVTSIGDCAFDGCTGLTAITIPSGVTSIGDCVFFRCTGLTSITIPSGVTAISDYAFYGCTGLTAITIGNGVTSIGWGAFYGCTGLTAITIPSGVTAISDYAFYHCTGLTSITIPSGVTSIGDAAFSGCTGLTSITVAEGNPVYDSRNNCNAIIETATNTLIAGCKNTVIPDSVTSIGWYAFNGCTGLTAISIPDSVTSIGHVAFSGCSGLTSITVAEGNPVYDSRNNCNAIIETATNTLIAGCKNTVIPDSVASIGWGAFSDCTGLTAISIPDGVTCIGDYAFVGCTGLTAISIGNGVTSIGTDAFCGCTGLTAIAIPDSVTSIGDWAFYGCTGLTAISIPSGVTSIGWYAFAGCTGLTDVYYPGTEEEWNAIDIGGENDPLANATIHFGQTEADPCEGYTDINRGSWYHSAADFVISRGLMGSTKTDALTFEPNTKVSRAMVASILYRMAGSPAATYKGTFTDVPDGKWFTTAIEWCAQNGLASGKGNGKFDPNGNVTRQELAVFMMKMAEYLGKDTSGRADLGSFADGTSVPSWAKEYVQWAVSAGLISGKANGGKTYLAPTDTATRAEFASIIMRFVQNIAEAK